MSFTSFNFLLFLAVVLVIYYYVPKRCRWFILLVASYTFYLINGIEHVLFIIGTTIVTYMAGILMQAKRNSYKLYLKKYPDLEKEDRQKLKKDTLASIHTTQVIFVLIILFVLIVVKYLNFLIGELNQVIEAGGGMGLSTVSIIVPLGISFYTFQSIGYVIDIGRGKYDAEKNIGKLALFVCFFPSIIQGPINRYNDVGVQLSEGHEFSYEDVTFGAQLIMWGFFKKLVIAERIAPIATAVYEGYEEYSGTVLIIGIISGAVHLYMDFSGGIDIARGVARMFGIDLPENFRRPYFSETIGEFWRRWHITLGAWMKDYVFFPVMLSKPVSRISKAAKKLFGNQAGKIAPSVVTTFVVFFLMGIWHGASTQYLMYAVYNGFIVSMGVALEPALKALAKKMKLDSESFSWKLFRIIRTFILTCISKVIVNSVDSHAFWTIMGKVITDHDLNTAFGVDGVIYTLGVDKANMTVAMLALAVVLLVSILQERGIKMRETIAKQNLVFRWAIYLGGFIVLFVFGKYGVGYSAADFVYGKF